METPSADHAKIRERLARIIHDSGSTEPFDQTRYPEDLTTADAVIIDTLTAPAPTAREDALKAIFGDNAVLSVDAVGSRVTCVPAPTDTDEDWLILVRDNGKAAVALGQAGYTLDNPSNHYRPEQSTFNSWRGPNSQNLIVTDDLDWHRKFRAATSVAKRLNLLQKSDRIALFQAVLYGMPSDQP